MCEGKAICESKDNILKWLSGKYIVLLYNQIRFAPNDFFEASTVKESRISYIPFNSQIRLTNPFSIQMTHLVLQDYNLIQLDSWTEDVHQDLFKMNEKTTMSLEL